jgi:DNA-directed RNA polymerase specialized sigma24 family protein
MYNFGFRLTLDRDDAKDLVQDTYLKAYRFIESFQKGTNAKGLAVPDFEKQLH